MPEETTSEPVDRVESPETFSGTPQAAEAEASSNLIPVDIDLLNRGEQLRNSGLLWPMDDDFGGGFMRILPPTLSFIAERRATREMQIRNLTAVKKKFKKSDTLTGKPGYELNRYVAILCCVEWLPERPHHVGGRVVDPSTMDVESVRKYIQEYFLPELNLTSSQPAERELNMTFLLNLMDGLGEVGEAPAVEIAEVGKDYKLGPSGNADYSA